MIRSHGYSRSIDNQTVNITLAITGASGSLFAAEALRQLEADPRVTLINLIASDSSLRVLAEELNVSGRTNLPERLLGCAPTKTHHLADPDIGANIASGSYPTAAMVILPCSMGTLASIAHGLASSLIERAADVCLKERRPLILCVRETPFNLIHLRNMTQATEAGATIYPVMPTLYNDPKSIPDMARNFVHRVMAHIGLPQTDAYRWKG